jgi:hypothetical protein
MWAISVSPVMLVPVCTKPVAEVAALQAAGVADQEFDA